MRLRIGLLIFALGLCAGCARTVTPIVNYGSQVMVEVTLRGTMDASSNRYFMVMSTNPSYQIPLPPPDNIRYEFIEPGMTPKIGNIADYYTYYFSGWDAYVIADPIGYYLTKGPFVQDVATTREVIASHGEITEKLHFTVRLDRIYPTVPPRVYFDIVTVKWPDLLEKYSQDHLYTNANFSTISGTEIIITDDENSALAPSLDIVKCKIIVQ